MGTRSLRSFRSLRSLRALAAPLASGAVLMFWSKSGSVLVNSGGTGTSPGGYLHPPCEGEGPPSLYWADAPPREEGRGGSALQPDRT
eukprot:4553010-Pyramimonas_sp.AAC.1